MFWLRNKKKKSVTHYYLEFWLILKTIKDLTQNVGVYLATFAVFSNSGLTVHKLVILGSVRLKYSFGCSECSRFRVNAVLFLTLQGTNIPLVRL